jgi:hypothetical protein
MKYAIESLEKKVGKRPAAALLLDHGILKGTPRVAQSLQAKQYTIYKAKINDDLNQKLLQRPPKGQLKWQNIIKDTAVIEPKVIALNRKRISQVIQENMENRLKSHDQPAPAPFGIEQPTVQNVNR